MKVQSTKLELVNNSLKAYVKIKSYNFPIIYQDYPGLCTYKFITCPRFYIELKSNSDKI